jgi:RNA polymerase sigma-70 factor (ECF subfamily)
VSDDRVFLEATLPHVEVVHRVARHLVSDPASAEDLVQETYLRAYAKFASHSGRSTRAWLVAICVNAARSQARQQKRRPMDLWAELPEVPDSGPDVCEQVAAETDRAALRAALARLAEPQRTALVLMHIGGLTAAETAQVLGCPRGTVLARAHRGRVALLRLLVAERESR